jgi:hypothetical protein
MSDNETAVAMRRMAEGAIKMGVRSGAALDYSIGSIAAVEQHVGEMYDFLRSPESTWDDKIKWSVALNYGGYVGEVIRRAAGGEWQAGTLLTDPKLVVGIVEIAPAAKVLKRMNHGIEDHLGHYVDSILNGLIPASAGKSGRVVVG